MACMDCEVTHPWGECKPAPTAPSPARDEARIDRIIWRVRSLWKRYPDWRLGQLIVNITGSADPFYIEDEHTEERLIEVGAKAADAVVGRAEKAEADTRAIDAALRSIETLTKQRDAAEAALRDAIPALIGRRAELHRIKKHKQRVEKCSAPGCRADNKLIMEARAVLKDADAREKGGA